MTVTATRRGFLGSAAGLLGLTAGSAPAAVEESPYGIKLGVASYSFREFQRALAIRCIRELQTPYVSVKEYHLLYHSTPDELEKGRREFEKAGLRIMSGGNIGLPNDDLADMRRYFEYAKMCGMPMIVCAPTHENLGKLESLVKEYNIKAAIHNHGPEDKHFPSPYTVLEAVRNLDPRVGLCMDVGHSARTGVDLVKVVADAGPRLLDMHIKDLRSAADKNSQCDVGQGALPIVGIFRQLHKMGYAGCVNLEYEIHADDPLPGMQRSFAYMRGVLAGLKG
ncbi:MAG TPA: sugar phosphate isomerase/epimerase [Bryobacteraceae bacterium]|nr:sugar phosphate isomerase/epimerase [Bryobacteraceae bacterium]